MSRSRFPLTLKLTGVAVAASLVLAAAPASGAGTTLSVLHSGVVTQQDIASKPHSETDTVAEPDVAVNPADESNAIAAAHDSRFPDGGAVDISVSWTKDSGATWHHFPVPGVTKAGGGPFERVSDPVVAFGADGTAYLSVLAFDTSDCQTAVAVLRSTDGGAIWSDPSYADHSLSCKYSDDKNWIVVDNGASSPHRGRVYQFWTPFLFADEAEEEYLGSPQAVRWSDDGAQTWSDTTYLTPQTQATQNSQPMIKADGTLVDTFYDYGTGGRAPDRRSPELAPGARPEAARGHGVNARSTQVAPRSIGSSARGIDATGDIVATTSTDGGATWSPTTLVTTRGGGYATGVRCCLFSANIDQVTGRMYVAWEGGVRNTDPVYASTSDTGASWSRPVHVSRGDVSGVQNVNVDVSARSGTAYVSYGQRTRPKRSGGYVHQKVATSTDAGLTYGKPQGIGPVSKLKYSARADGHFPGDYMGTAVSDGLLYVVWASSSRPPRHSTSKYHQVIWGVTLRR